MNVTQEYFDRWMERIIKQLERIEKLYQGRHPHEDSIFSEGQRLLDNADLCQMLNVSKRTLQRYRTLGELPYQMIYNKTLYKESDVQRFIETHFSNFEKTNGKKKK